MGHAEFEGKDTGGKREGLTVQVTYKDGRGQMTVNVPEFLKMRRIGRYRRLMKLIRQSDTPNVADRVVRYIRRELADMDVRMRDVESKAEEARSGAGKIRMDISRLTVMRDRARRGPEQYRMYSQQIKDLRQSQRTLNGLYRGYEADLKTMQRDRFFYQKIMDEEDKG